MTEEQLEIQRLKKVNKELYKTIEDLSANCYKCTCGIASECNCFHLGLKSEPIRKMDNDPSRLAFEVLLKGLDI